MSFPSIQFGDLVRLLPTFDPSAPILPQVLHLVMWAGMFACTVLFFRMLITRWGDEHVTAKAVVLSGLLHAIAGMWTTTILLVPKGIEREDKPLALRAVITSPEEAASDNSARDSSPTGSKPWERLPSLPDNAVTRSAPTKAETLAEPQRTPRDADLSSVPLPDVSQPNDARESAPQVTSADQRASEGAVPEALNEQTAEARPEVRAVSTPGRQKGAATPLAGEITPPERKSASASRPDDALPAALGPRPTIADQPGRPDAAPDVIGSDADTVASSRAARTNRPSTGIGEVTTGDTNVATGQEPGGKQPTTASGRFQRMSAGKSRAGDGTGLDPLSDAEITGSRRGSQQGEGTVLGEGLSSRTLAGTTSGRDSGPDALSGDESSSRGRRMGTPDRYRLRGAIQRRDLAPQFGATESSEKAVEAALVWMAAHQSPAGNWDPDGFGAMCPADEKCTGHAAAGTDPDTVSLQGKEREERNRSGTDADTGITGLVLLAYLGAGYTQMEGKHADTVDKGLRWMIRAQRADGYLGGKASYYAGIYCHGIATIALAEAYAMTHDASLRKPLQNAVSYILTTQNASDGGWRYEKAQVGDMSVFGWQLMALKSAQAGGISIPQDAFVRSAKFLNQAALGDKGGLAGYGSSAQDKRVKASMTAEALFCRQLLGAPRTGGAAIEAVAYLNERPPTLKNYDLYYWYYATLAMYQHGGEPWRDWNDSLQTSLLSLQRKTGHGAGSWDPHAPWGDYGGRLFSTAMSTLCLEVYYRFAPGTE